MSVKKAIVVLSGGMDSTTLLYRVIKEGYETEAISFFYGQKHEKELVLAARTCKKLGVKHQIIDVSFLKDLLKSSLTDDSQEIPEGHYEEENMKSTVVPNRNMILTSIAVGYGLSIGAEIIALGVHGGDHAIYPDCRTEFFEKLNKVVEICDWNKVTLYAPYLDMNKISLLEEGIRNEVDYSLTWTCYKGKERACGVCGSCQERLEAFKLNGIKDPVEYEPLLTEPIM